MLATPGPLPIEPGWAFEVKWDGVRAFARVQDGQARLTSRNGNDITGAYPELLRPHSGQARSTPMLIDGEVVALDAAGRPDFGRLQARMHVRAPDAALVRATPVVFITFDVLHVGDRSLLHDPYDDRRRVLGGLGLTGPSWQLAEAFLQDGAAVVEATRAQGMEGVVAKRRDSCYEPGRRSEHWVKVKHQRRQSAVIGGWQAGEGNRSGQIGSLLLGVGAPVPGGSRLLFAGHVGTGFTAVTLRQLAVVLAPLGQVTSPFTHVPREFARTAHWVQPVLVCEVEFTAWTRDDRLRHPSYKGLRDDLDPTTIVREP